MHNIQEKNPLVFERTMAKKLKWFGYVKGKNNDEIVKTKGEIKGKKTDRKR